MARLDVNFFKFKPENESVVYTIPNTTNEDSLSFTSNWTTSNVQGSTEAVTAFNYVSNPTIPINLKFCEDLWREYPNDLTIDYVKTINGLASLQYPVVKGSTIYPPYCRIEFNGKVFRGYFTNIKLTESGPFRRSVNKNGVISNNTMHRTHCDFTASFVVVKSSSAPTRSGIANSLNNYFS